MPDVGAFFDLEIPAEGLRVVFWRNSLQTLTKHRNPIFQPDVGLDPSTSLTVDELHANYLGVMKVFCKLAVWLLITNGVYGAVGTDAENMQIAVLVLRHRLIAWYKEVRVMYPGLTKLGDLTLKMLGTASAPQLNSKGAETWGIFLFLVSELEAYQGRMGGDGVRYLEAGVCLKRTVEVFKACGPQIPDAVRQDCLIDRAIVAAGRTKRLMTTWVGGFIYIYAL